MRNSTRSSSLSTIVRSCRLRRPRREEEGATLVEFAIILPVFALMLFGMIQFGLAFAGWDELRNAVQTSARLAANSDVIPSNPELRATRSRVQPVMSGRPLDRRSGGYRSHPARHFDDPVDSTESPEYTCPPRSSRALHWPGGGYAWLDGYYIFENGQWLQIVNGMGPVPGQINDTQAFDDGVGTWSCASSNCSTYSYERYRPKPERPRQRQHCHQCRYDPLISSRSAPNDK